MKFLQVIGFSSFLLEMIDCNTTTEKPEDPKFFIYPKHYMNEVVPFSGVKGQPFVVRIDVIVWSITELSLRKQEMEVDLMVNLFWRDPRLSRNPAVSASRPWTLLGSEAHYIWKPRLLFRNCKGCKPVSMDPLDTAIYANDSATMWAEIRTLLKFTCSIDLRNYPMDVQRCKMQIFLIEEYNDVIVLKQYYEDRHRRMWSNMTISEFYIPDFDFGDCTFQDFYNYTYSCVEVMVRFERRISYHIMITYAPTTFIVILSWISFWLPASVVPARVALGLTSLLTMATRLDQAQHNLPPVSYVKAIDIWMFACLTLVSASLLEFAVSNFAWRPKPKPPMKRPPTIKKPAAIQVRPYKFIPPPRPVGVLDDEDSVVTHEGETPLDRAARAIFPMSFILFNFIYWGFYLSQ